MPIAFDKAVIGSPITWIAATYSLTPSGLEVRIKESLVDETVALMQQILGGNYVLEKVLRTCIGKAMYIASLITVVRPFLSELYAALQSPSSSKHGLPVIWTKQIAHSLTWLLILLTESRTELVRRFDLCAYLGQGTRVEICLDASPWGLGGFLVISGRITAWFACVISTAEKELLHIVEGDCAAQQTVEALAVLVALRAWKNQWIHKRVMLKIKSDSISALVIAFKLKTKGSGSGTIAREVALDIACSEYQPHIVEHIPGVDNVIADELSRRYQPGHEFVLPAILKDVPETVFTARGREYFKTADTPSLVRRFAVKRGGGSS